MEPEKWKFPTLSELGISSEKNNGVGFTHRSFLCGALLEIARRNRQNFEFSEYLIQIAQSFAQLYTFSVMSYGRSAKIVTDNYSSESFFLDNQSIAEDFIFTFLTSAKSALDIYCCGIDAIIDMQVPEPRKMTDTYKLKSRLSNEEGLSPIVEFLSSSWIQELEQARHQIIHRGFFPRYGDYDRENQLTEFHLSRRSFLRDRNQRALDNGLFSDGKGNFISPCRIETIVKGFINDFQLIDTEAFYRSCANHDLTLPEGISPLDILYGNVGLYVLTHEHIGEFI